MKYKRTDHTLSLWHKPEYPGGDNISYKMHLISPYLIIFKVHVHMIGGSLLPIH